MGEAIDKLFEIASDSLSTHVVDQAPWAEGWETAELRDLLSKRNGFYALESAVHVFPWTAADVMNIYTWNASDTWKALYKGAADECLFFAENGIGNQFALDAKGIVRFNPETAEVEQVASTIEEWAQRLLDDNRNLEHWQTAWPLAHDWQVRNGPLPNGKRLVPVIPFILGGEYAVDNLIAMDEVEGVRLRADIWRQVGHLPAGSRVKIEVKKPSQ